MTEKTSSEIEVYRNYDEPGQLSYAGFRPQPQKTKAIKRADNEFLVSHSALSRIVLTN